MRLWGGTPQQNSVTGPRLLGGASATVAVLIFSGCGTQIDDIEAVGSQSAAAIGPITCGSKYLNQSTSGGSSIASYACAPGLTLGGNEWIRSFTVATAGDVVLSAVNYNTYPFIAVLRDTASGVNAANCLTGNYYSVRFPAAANDKFYVVVDHDTATSPLTFDIDINCSAPQNETQCADGFDNDADMLIDCADPDCASSSSCSTGKCLPSGTLKCGDTLIAGNTSSFSTDVVNSYTCASDRSPTAPEHAYTFQPTADARVAFTVSDFTQYPMLFVLEDDGTGCNPNRCAAFNYYSVEFDAKAGKTYYLVADGRDNTSYQYNASVICNPPTTETNCSDNIDNDGDGAVDCQDSDCKTNAACTSAQCTSVQNVDCTTWKLHDSTANAGSTDVIASYSCSPSTSLGNAERAYKLGPLAQTTSLVATLSNQSTYGMIAVVEDKGTGCVPSNCVAEQYGSVKFSAQKGKTYYVIVEGHDAPTVSYDLSIICGASGNETACADGVDNDGDLATDCNDSDCASVCQCAPAGTLTDSTKLLAGSTGAAGSTNTITSYGCYPATTLPGSEYVYTYVAPATERVLFTLSNMSAPGMISVLPKQGSTCNVGSCAAEQYYSVMADVTKGSTYYVAVDGPNAGTMSYSISVVPNPPSSEAGLCTDGIDDDGDFLIDCYDPDCNCTP